MTIIVMNKNSLAELLDTEQEQQTAISKLSANIR